MKRIVEIHGTKIYYRGSQFSELFDQVRKYFKLKGSRLYKYEITIKEGTQCHIEPRFKFSCFYAIRGETYPDKYCGELYLCKSKFDELFFKPDPFKRYDITVKKIKK